MFSTGTEGDPVVVYKIYRDKQLEFITVDDVPF